MMTMSSPPWRPDLQAGSDALPTADEVGRALADVFARPELTPREPGLLARLGQRLWDAVTSLVRQLFGPVDLSADARSFAFTVVLAVLGTVALAALGWTVWGLVRRWRVRSRRVRAPTGADVRAREPVVAPGEWEIRAREAAAAGRWRDAAVALYRALLLRLDARGAVEYHRAKTPGDYRREAVGDPALGPTLDGFLRAFERAAYGAGAADPDGYARLRTAAAELGVRG
ncbi:MAG: DUF4129 domain-containing protein [Gemmatimonadota bacterium]